MTSTTMSADTTTIKTTRSHVGSGDHHIITTADSSTFSFSLAHRQSLSKDDSCNSNTFARSSTLFADGGKRLSLQPSQRKTNSLEDITINKLNFANVDLMGRDKEVAALQQAYGKITRQRGAKKQLFLLSGYSGVGKTRLARSLYQTIKKESGNNGLYVEGKFDQNCSHSKPYLAFSSICGMICSKILAMDQADDVCSAIAVALGSETKVLYAAFPVLEEILQNREFQNASCSRSATTGIQQQRPEEAKFRLNFAFCRFLRVLGEYFALVMVLDDLQWADVPSLDLLQDILGDHKSHKIRIVGIYRSNEVDENHIFSSVIREVRNKVQTRPLFNIQELVVGNLELDSIVLFLKDLLGTTDDSVMRLALACQKKTHGNAFFMIHFLQYIYSKHLLHYNFGAMKWQWKEEEIDHDTMASDNVVDFVLQKMKALTPKQHDVLRLAACLGASFKEHHMQILWNQLGSKQEAANSDEISEDLMVALDLCVLDGYLYASSASDGDTEYIFVHDKVQEAAYLLTNRENLADFQNWVGEILREALTPDALNSMLFIVVNLLNEGMLPTEVSKRVELAELNCRTCAAAMKGSAFQAVARHAAVGIELLGDKAFTDHPKLAIELYSMGSGAESYLGNIKTMETYCQTVIGRTDVPTEDKLQVYSTWFDSLANRGHFAQAVDEILHLLNHFKTWFPRNRAIQKIVTLSDMKKTKKDIGNGMLKKIQEAPVQNDPTRAQLVHLMDRLSVYLYFLNNSLMPLVIIRTVQWTFKYGLNNISPVSLATMGLIFTGIIGDLKSGSDCAQAALDLVPQVSRLVEGRILLVAHLFGVVWTSHVREQLTPLQKGYSSALCAGDKESACWCIYIFCMFRFLTGFPLDLIIEDVKLYLPQMLELNQLIAYRCMLSHHQMHMNLAGRTDTDPLSLTGDYLTKEDHEAWLVENPYYESQCKHWQSYILTMYSEHEQCAKLALVNGTHLTLITDPGGFPMSYMEVFSKGISSFVAAQITSDKKRRKKYRKSAMIICRRVKDWIGKGCPNFSHLNAFFDAQTAALQGERHVAIQTYQGAIVIAARGGLMLDAGVFSEIFGEYLLELGEKEDAHFRLQEAIKYFREFGAMQKVAMIESKHGKFLSPQLTWLYVEQ